MRWASDRKICAVQNCQNGRGLRYLLALLQNDVDVVCLDNTLERGQKALATEWSNMRVKLTLPTKLVGVASKVDCGCLRPSVLGTEVPSKRLFSIVL